MLLTASVVATTIVVVVVIMSTNITIKDDKTTSIPVLHVRTCLISELKTSVKNFNVRTICSILRTQCSLLTDLELRLLDLLEDPLCCTRHYSVAYSHEDGK